MSLINHFVKVAFWGVNNSSLLLVMAEAKSDAGISSVAVSWQLYNSSDCQGQPVGQHRASEGLLEALPALGSAMGDAGWHPSRCMVSRAMCPRPL